MNTLMKNLTRNVSSVLLGVALVFGLMPIMPASAEENGEDTALVGGSYADDKIIVVFDEGVQSGMRASSIGAVQGATTRMLSEDLGSDEAGAAVAVDLPEGVSVEDALAQVREQPGVYAAQPCYRYSLIDQEQFANVDEGELVSADEVAASREAAGTGGSDLSPQDTVQPMTTVVNDPFANVQTDSAKVENQWWLYNANLFDSWDIAQADHRVTVCVLDTGINFDHPDLADNILADYAYDSYAQAPLTASPSSSLFAHGSHVAGIVAGVANNGIGIAGASYNADILPINCFYEAYSWSSGQGAYTDDEYLINAYEYLFSDSDGNGKTVAEETNTRVVNMSLGGYGESDDALEAIIDKAKDEGILSVCAGGNGDDYGNPVTTPTSPGDLDACISVVATGSDNVRASWADHNQYKDISAPGLSIWSTWYTGSQYYCASGTSMASPLVAGIAAQLFALNPNLTVDEVKGALYNTATDLGSEGWDEYYGWGLVNAAEAVRFVGKVRISPATETVYHTQKVQMNAAPIQEGVSVEGWTWSVTPGTGDATIDQSGLLTATKAGSVKVTASATVDGVTVDGSTTVRITEIDLSSDLTATTDGYGSVELAWGAAVPVDLITGYRVYRADLSSDTYALIDTAASSAVGYSDTTAEPGKPYHYKVVVVADMDGNATECGTSGEAMGVLFAKVFSLTNQSDAIDYLLMRNILADTTTTSIVVVGEGASITEGLIASSLAGIVDAPVIVVGAASLSEAARRSIEGSGAAQAYIVGGEDEVSAAVGADVQSALGTDAPPIRFSGSTVAGLAEAVYSGNAGRWGDTAVIVADSADVSNGALAATPYLWAAGAPVFSTNASGKLSATTRNKIRTGAFPNALIIGSSATVSNEVEAQLTDCGVPATGIVRLAAEEETSLSADIASYAIVAGALDADGLYASEPDLTAALTAAAPAGTDRLPLVFVKDGDESGFATLLDDLSADAVESITFVDGTAAIDAVEKDRIARIVRLADPALTDLSAASITGVHDVVYDGTAWEPSVAVALNGETLVEGRDYRVSFADNVDVGTARVKVSGIGGYWGSAETAFAITNADNTALLRAIEAACADRDETPVSADGSDLAPGTAYVTSVTYPNTLTVAINKAQKVADEASATQAQITAALTELQSVKDEFDAGKKTVGVVDKIALQATITAGRADLAVTAVSADGSDLAAGTRYVSEAEAQSFAAAIAQAEAVADDPGASSARVTETLAALVDAQAVFTAAKRTADAPAPTGIVLNRSSLMLAALRSTILVATVSPTEAASGATVTWTSDNDGIARVSADGVVTSVTAGRAVITATTENGLSASCTVVVTSGSMWTRLQGDNRYDTMSTIVSEAFSGIGGTVILAYGGNYPDVLAASALAGAFDAPIVLTESDSLSAEARTQLVRLAPANVIVMGGQSAVSQSVVDRVAGLPFAPSVSRVSGGNRQETSVEAYSALTRSAAVASDTCIIATGAGYADALSVSPYAYATNSPVFLTEQNGSLTERQVEVIRAAGFTRVVLVGGSGAVSDSVKDRLSDAAHPDREFVRLGGADRYDTSARIVAWEVEQGMKVNGMAIATGEAFPDALAGSPLCGKGKSVLVLACDANTSALDAVLSEHGGELSTGYVFGGTTAVSEKVLAEAEGYTG